MANKQRGKSPRVSTTFTIEKYVIDEFRKYSIEHCINMSAYIEKQIKQLLKIK